MKGFTVEQATRVKVAGSGDLFGTIDAASWRGGGGTAPVRVRLDDGRELFAPREVIVRQPDGSFELSLGRTDLARLTEALGADAKDVTVLPVVAEQLAVGKRVVETGRVRVTKVVREQEQVVDQPLLREEVVVERVPVERFVDGPVAARQDGDAIVIPLVEEVIVIEKRLMVKEEVRISRRQIETRQPQTVTVRTEDVRVERVPAGGAADGGTGGDSAGRGTDVA